MKTVMEKVWFGEKTSFDRKVDATAFDEVWKRMGKPSYSRKCAATVFDEALQGHKKAYNGGIHETAFEEVWHRQDQKPTYH